MASARKRKATTADATSVQPRASKQPRVGDPGAHMKMNDSFSTLDERGKKRGTGLASPVPSDLLRRTTKAEQRRKRGRDSVVSDTEEDDATAKPSAKVARVLKCSAGLMETSTPRHQRFTDALPPTPGETPSKSTAALFKKLKLAATVEPIAINLGGNQEPYTPPDTPGEDRIVSTRSTPELEEQSRLYAAFLSALSMYYAHNGRASPVNVGQILPMITKCWNKRAVKLEDLRRLLGLQGDSSPFLLQDFGRAGVCLTKAEPRGRSLVRAEGFVNESALGARFDDALQTQWATWRPRSAARNREAAAFIEQLPVCPISQHESVDKAAPVFARGQQRLADIKASQATAQRHPVPTPAAVGACSPTSSGPARPTSLLDRILAKQALTASLPAGPTKQQLERNAALHRVEDVARVLDLLAAGRSRCSFSLPATVQHLQQSLRSPIGREEVERCLEIMSSEMTPGFVGLLRNGSVTGVVITRGGKVDLDELRTRVRKALV